MKRIQRREATPVAHMILSERMADHEAHDMVYGLVGALDAEALEFHQRLGSPTHSGAAA